MNYQTEVAQELAKKTGWSMSEAASAIGDTTHYRRIGMTPAEAADAVLDDLHDE